jgi:hypothetical protein
VSDRERNDDPIEPSPEGASCGEHPERDALVTCPRCRSHVCIACWHNAVRRCHACLVRDPGPPVPWQDESRSLPARLLATLGDALHPTRSAPTFVRAEWRRGISFALLTFVPLALVSGIVPYTHTIGFGPSFAVRLLGSPEPAAIALDVARAAGIGALVAVAMLLLLAVPYHSLSRAYGTQGRPEPAISVMLYRAWLIPLGAVIQSLLAWSVPGEPSESFVMVVEVASMLPLLLMISSMLSTARMASGVGPIAALVVVLVPFALMTIVGPLGMQMLRPWMPDPEVLREALGA